MPTPAELVTITQADAILVRDFADQVAVFARLMSGTIGPKWKDIFTASVQLSDRMNAYGMADKWTAQRIHANAQIPDEPRNARQPEYKTADQLEAHTMNEDNR